MLLRDSAMLCRKPKRRRYRCRALCAQTARTPFTCRATMMRVMMNVAVAARVIVRVRDDGAATRARRRVDDATPLSALFNDDAVRQRASFMTPRACARRRAMIDAAAARAADAADVCARRLTRDVKF